jgi:hypothetical protein
MFLVLPRLGLPTSSSLSSSSSMKEAGALLRPLW